MENYEYKKDMNDKDLVIKNKENEVIDIENIYNDIKEKNINCTF